MDEKTRFKTMGALSLIAVFVIVFYQIVALPGMVQVLMSLLGVGVGGMGGYAIGATKYLKK